MTPSPLTSTCHCLWLPVAQTFLAFHPEILVVNFQEPHFSKLDTVCQEVDVLGRYWWGGQVTLRGGMCRAFVAEYVDAVCRLDIVRPHIRKVARKVQAALASSLSNGMRTQVL